MTQKVIHLASSHYVNDARIFQKECRTLATNGYDVIYLVPHTGDGKVDDIQIRAVDPPESGKERYLKTIPALYKQAMSESHDAVYHIHEADLLPIALLLKARGRKVIYDAHEDTPLQTLYQEWIPRMLRRPATIIYSTLEKLAGWSFDGIIAAEPRNAERFPPNRTTIIHNFPIINELTIPNALPYAKRKAIIAYVGGLTTGRGLFEMNEALQQLPESYGAVLQLAGAFHPVSLRDRFYGMINNSRVRHLGRLSRQQVARLLAEARVGLVVLHPYQKYRESYPTKLFEYMSAGLPVIASDFPSWRVIVEEAHCGILVDPLDTRAISKAIQWLLDHPKEAEEMGARGRALVEEKYNWEREAKRLVAFYTERIGPPN